MEIMRQVWTEKGVAWKDAPFSFENATIEPQPVGGPPPLWYCGATPRSARLAVESLKQLVDQQAKNGQIQLRT